MILLNNLVRISKFGLVPVFSFSQTTRRLTSQCCFCTLESERLWGCLLTRKVEAKWGKLHCFCGITALLVLGVTCNVHILQGVCMYTVCSGLCLSDWHMSQFIHFGLKPDFLCFCPHQVTVFYSATHGILFHLPLMMFWQLTRRFLTACSATFMQFVFGLDLSWQHSYGETVCHGNSGTQKVKDIQTEASLVRWVSSISACWPNKWEMAENTTTLPDVGVLLEVLLVTVNVAVYLSSIVLAFEVEKNVVNTTFGHWCWSCTDGELESSITSGLSCSLAIIKSLKSPRIWLNFF